MKKNITIKFIAEKAGVSTTTISRYLNGKYECMSKNTKDNIEKIINKYNYQANNMARGLKSKKSKLIGIVVSTLKYQVASHQVRGMNDVLTENGFSTIIYNSNNDEQKESDALRMCLNQQVDGIILMPNRMNCKLYTEIHESETPVILYNRYRECWKYDGAYIDNAKLTYNALVHMYNNGYKRIAFITDNVHKSSNKTFREASFIEFAEKYMHIEGRNQIYLVQDQSDAKNALTRFLNIDTKEKKGIFIINSDTSFLILKEIREIGLSIPYDLAICAYDATGWSELITPGITSLDQPNYLMGARAAELLIKNLQDKDKEVEQIWLKGTMHIRDSTKGI